ncbi:MAG TPA: hypothetical protein VJV79_17060, partial [Polyangiaceae bacterium]|nr:hypothetical protein [Polyangiaceae bacterium]
PWTESSCEDALSAGKTGDPCVGNFKCSVTIDCCSILAYCEGSALTAQSNCTLCPVKCSADSDCGAKELCENYQCRSCPTQPCPETWSAVLRNGCPVCVPPSQCKQTGDPVCGELSCIAGFSCLPGCKSDPSCCFGNRCVEASCSILKELDCVVVGCFPGSICKVDGAAVECKCQPSSGTFSCTGTRRNSCNAY